MGLERILRGSRIAEIDRKCINGGIDSKWLMKNAGNCVSKEIKGDLKNKKDANGIIICGGGNNGGDGFVAAIDLIKAGFDIKVFYISPTEKFSSDSSYYFNKLSALKGSDTFYLNMENQEVEEIFGQQLDSAYFIVDAIFGTGLHGKEIYGQAKTIINRINQAKSNKGKLMYSVDIPSGIDSDNGMVLGTAVRADKTITFGCKKLGIVNFPGAEYAGKIKVVDIGIPPKHFSGYEDIFKVRLDWVCEKIPERQSWTYKHKVGKLLVVAGSIGLSGAASMACLSAMRAGAGLVTLVCPWELNSIFEQKLTEVMTYPVDQTDDVSIHYGSLEKIIDLSSNFDALAIGPGISKNLSTLRLVREILKEVKKPTVLDADGLAALYSLREADQDQNFDLSHVIITPHAGELSVILGRDKISLDQRYDVNVGVARQFNLVSVLKGARTLISEPDGTTFINNTGDWALATAGTGDILTGIIGSLLSQGMDKFEGAACGVFIHGMASDIVSKNTSKTSMIATDLLEGIKKTFLKIERIKYKE